MSMHAHTHAHAHTHILYAHAHAHTHIRTRTHVHTHTKKICCTYYSRKLISDEYQDIKTIKTGYEVTYNIPLPVQQQTTVDTSTTLLSHSILYCTAPHTLTHNTHTQAI